MRTLKESLNKCTKLWLNPFVKDVQGNVAIIFGLTAIPVLMAAGLGIDYGQASDAKALMQSSADSAIISAILDTTTSTCASKQANATKVIATLINEKPWVHFNNDVIVTDDADGGCKVTFSAKVDTAIIRVIGINAMNVSVTSSAVGGIGKKLEIVLALDNTASMKDQGMIDLKLAANNFVDTLSARVPATQLKLGLVPFVAMVNPGKSYINNASMSDFQGEADYHGYYPAGRLAHIALGCPYDGTPWTGSGGGSFPRESSIVPKNIYGKSNTKFSYIFQELLGVKGTLAAELGGGTTTPTDLSTILSTWVEHHFTDPNSGSDRFVALPPTNPPTDHDFTFGPFYSNGGNTLCPLYNPMRINHFDLFSRTGTSGVPWKGCVMARKAPYDVDDSPPVPGDANTKFVPFFWPSEPSVDGLGANNNVFGDPTNPIYKNVYMPFPQPDTYADVFLYSPDVFGSSADIFKYNKTDNGLSPFTTIENAVDTLGPNKGCPNAVTPLTSSTSTIKTEINNLTRWNGGGTVTSEGLMWAWRVLSPNLPYAMGAPYADTSVQKYIVLMSDGVNYLNQAGPNLTPLDQSPITTEQSAYGAIWSPARGSGWVGNVGKTFAPQVVGTVMPNSSGIYDKPSADALLNDRFTKACDNAKMQGIKVFAIYFSHGDPVDATAVNYLKNCADTINYYDAANSVALQAAFDKIAKSIVAGGVRLTK